MKPKKSLFSRTGQAAAFVTAVTFCVAGHSFAADYTWNAATADFNTPTNWSIGGNPAAAVPDALDTASVANGGTAQWTANAAKTVLDLRVGNGAAGAVSISGGNIFTTNGNVLVGRQNGSATGELTVSGANTRFNVTSGNTIIGGVSTDVGVTDAGATGILNITTGAVFTHNPAGDDSFRVGDNTPPVVGDPQGGSYKGTVNVDGGTLNLPNGSRLYIAQSPGSVGEVKVTNNGTINVANDWIVVGRGGSGKLTLESGTITKAGAEHVAIGDLAGTGVVDHTGGTFNANAGEFRIGLNVGATGTYNLGTGAVLNTTFWTAVGRSGGTGILNVNGGTLTKTGGGMFMVGARDGGASTGTVNQTAGTVNINDGQLWLGQNANDANGKSSGTYNLSGGTLNVNNWIGIGREGGNGVLNVSGGTLNKTGDGGFHVVVGQGNSTNTGKMTVSDNGIVNIQTGALWVSENSAGEVAISGNGLLQVGAVQVAVLETGGAGNLKLNGGILKTGRIFGGGGLANVEFNGTTIQATANQTAFLENIDSADIKAGGAKFDTGAFNIAIGTPDTFGQVLTGTGAGGLTKEGTGTLTLNSPNTYQGPTTVTAGKLVVSTASLATGAVTVAANAGFGVNIDTNVLKTQPAALTFGQSTTLDINVGLAGGPVDSPLGVGTLTLNGTAANSTLVNISGTGWSLGTFPILTYGTVGGSGGITTLKLGTLPTGMQATLTHNVGTKTFNLNVTRLSIPVWNGSLTQNTWNTVDEVWTNQIDGSPIKYTNGDVVYFGDSPVRTDVLLSSTVTPGASVTFANETVNYILSGAGKISGTTRLLKQLAGTVTLSTANNDFTGGVRIEGGSIIIGSLSNGGLASPIGAAAAAPANLVLAGGTLSYTGATATTNRGFTIGAENGGIEITDGASNLTVSGALAATAGGLVKKGAGTLTLTGSGAIGMGGATRVEAGKLVVNGTGTTPAQVVTAGELWVGNTAASAASMEITNTTLTTSNWMAVGRGNGEVDNVSTLNISNSTVTVVNLSVGFDAGRPNRSVQNINISNASTFNNTSQTLIGESRGSTSNITVSGDSRLNTRELLAALGGGVKEGASAATITLQDTSIWNVGTEANIAYASIGRNGGTGNLIVKGSASFLNFDDFSLAEEGTSTGTLTIQDAAIVAVRTPLLGRGAGGIGLVTQTGGSFSSRGVADFEIGVSGNATYNLSGGTVNSYGRTDVARNGSSTSSLNISGGTFTHNNADLLIHIGAGGNGTLNVSGTGLLTTTGGLYSGSDATGVGTISQTGGIINIGKNVILGDNGKATVNLSGGQFNMKTSGTTDLNFVVGNNGTAQATLNISGSADVRLMNNASLRLGNTSTSADNTVNQTGGNVTSYSDNGTTVGGTGIVVLGRENPSTAVDKINPSGTNVYNLSGGTLTTGAVTKTSPAGFGVLNFDGGTLKASGNNAAFVSNLTKVEIQAGGAKIDTNTYNVTVVNALVQGVGGGGLTKNGAGTLTLAGVNTYDGNTVINAGGLTLADDGQLRFLPKANGVTNSVSGTGAATFNGDFNIVTSSAVAANGNSWTLVAGPVNETYGASFNVVGYTKSGNVWTRVDGANTWTFSQTNGTLTVTTGGVVDPYATWTSTYFPGVTDQNIIGRNADPDGDGSSNALEFALGGAPNSGTNNPKVYSLQADGSVDGDSNKELLLTIAVRSQTPAFSADVSPTAAKDGVIYTVQGSLDLAGFTTGVTAVNVVAPASAPEAPTGYEYRTFSLNGSNNLTGKGFLRVKVN